MSHVCREDLTGFDRLLRLPAEHPDRKAVEDCPRCGSRLRAYQAFLRASDAPGSDPGGAQARLTAFIASTLPAALPPAREAPTGQTRWKLPGFRWLVPVAAVVIMIAIGVWRMQPANDRSHDVRAVGDAATLVMLPVRQVNGALELSWEPVPSADAYEVRLLTSDFTEVRRVGPVSATTLRLSVDDERASYCQVVALALGDEIAASAIRRLAGEEPH
jgi:hypothetical protein